MKMKASDFRKNIYLLLDQILESGVPLDIEWNGSTLKIIPGSSKKDKLSNLIVHDCIIGDPEDLVHCDYFD